ncbi:hypothetical protein PMAC_000014 [Pneumocystis sp. 'macacae']|nr:hypothetical protein PMAC_000014 [Pneumocystis sp. 'macacae']
MHCKPAERRDGWRSALERCSVQQQRHDKEQQREAVKKAVFQGSLRRIRRQTTLEDRVLEAVTARDANQARLCRDRKSVWGNIGGFQVLKASEVRTEQKKADQCEDKRHRVESKKKRQKEIKGSRKK